MEKSYIIETIQVGHQVKVTAVDPDTGDEVSIMAPANTLPARLKQLAINKLHYVQAKKQSE